MKQVSFELDGRKYELTIDDPEIQEEIQGIAANKELTDEQSCLMLGVLYYDIDPEYGHAFLRYVFGSEREILEKMYTESIITIKNIERVIKYMKEHIDNIIP
jgi:hypothetical protein